MPIQVIKDIHGKTMWAGEAPSRKAFIQQLVAQKKSLAQADLKGANLAHLDLRGVDLSKAMLDGADLRGSKLGGGKFRFASMRGVNASGARADRADFSGADFTRNPKNWDSTTFASAVLSYAKLDGTKIEKTDFSRASMSSSTIVGASVHRAIFDGAIMHNVDWADSEVVNCSFRKAVMRPTWGRLHVHLPDRTKDTVVLGNDMKDAELGIDSAAFKEDAVIGKGISWLIWGTLTVGAAVATSAIPIDESVLNGSVKNVGLIAVTTAAILLRAKAEDAVKELAGGVMADTFLNARKVINNAVRAGRALSSMAAAFVTSGQADAIIKAMYKPDEGIIGRLKAVATGKIELLICDKKHLAEALARITDVIGGRYRKDTDIVVVRTGEASEKLPRAVAIRKDGSVEAYYSHEGKEATLRWKGEGMDSFRLLNGRWRPYKADRNKALKDFMEAVVYGLGIPELTFDPETHMVRKGRDGSVVILRRADNRLHNPHGPVIHTPSTEANVFLPNRSGKYENADANEDEENPRRLAP